MKILNIVRSEPDEMVEKCIHAFSQGKDAKVIALYKENVDWQGLVDDIFAYDKVICWW